MTPAARSLIDAVHAAPPLCVLVVTGGGAGAVAQLLSIPGASRTVLEALVPYHNRSLVEFLGSVPEQFCSADTSRVMAERAHERATLLAPGQPVVGLGCTATLVTDRPKRGDHRLHLSTCDGLSLTTRSLTLTRGARDRDGEEAVVDAVLLNALAEAMGLPQRVDPGLREGEQLHREGNGRLDPLSRFLASSLDRVWLGLDGQARCEGSGSLLLVPGSFNPLHAGHLGLARAAAMVCGREAHFELSVRNVDKPELTPHEVRRRLAQFSWRAPVWLSRAPTFLEKARLFPGAAFAIGADTARRLVDVCYYGQSVARMEAALREMGTLGSRFLVAGRMCKEDRYECLGDIALPASARALFQEIPEESFRLDLSSTELRHKR